MVAPLNSDRRRRWWRRSAALISLLLSLIVVEAVLQIRAYEPGFYLLDPVRGWRLNPGFHGWYEKENHVWIQINSRGLRDREHQLTAAPGALRIAVIGDSFMEALNVPFEQSFVAQLEANLNDCSAVAGRTVEVINFGVSGYGTAQQLFTYRDDVVRYRPDVVLLAVYTENDIIDNHRELSQDERERPYVALRNGRLEPAPPLPPPDLVSHLPWYQRWRVALTERFLSAAAVWDGYSALRAALGTSPPPPAPVAAGDSDDDQELVMLAPPRSRELRDAWEITEALLATLAAEAMSHASEFWMTTLSVAEQTDPDVRKRAAVAAALGVDSLYYPDHRIREFARARAIPLVSLAEPLADYSARTGEFLNGGYNVDYPHGSGHWNATAHGLAARMVGERLCAQSPAFAGSR